MGILSGERLEEGSRMEKEMLGGREEIETWNFGSRKIFGMRILKGSCAHEGKI